jgi:large subunit ribosomal protein L16
MINPTPRKFRKPNKKTIRNTYENKTNKLSFGTFGIQATEKGFLTVQQIEAVRKILVKKIKKTGKVWLRAFPDYARTAKPKEVRMGKGKGAVDR